MQTVVKVRASHGDLQRVLSELALLNIRVISVTKGSEWGRIGLSYNWTVVLEGEKLYTEKMPKIESIIKNATKRSYWKTAALFVGLLVGLGVMIGVFYSIAMSVI